MFLTETKGGSVGPDPDADYYFVVINGDGDTISHVAMEAGSPGSPAPAGGYIGLLNAVTDEVEFYVETAAGAP
jgi:hypothetical protein